MVPSGEKDGSTSSTSGVEVSWRRSVPSAFMRRRRLRAVLSRCRRADAGLQKSVVGARRRAKASRWPSGAQLGLVVLARSSGPAGSSSPGSGLRGSCAEPPPSAFAIEIPPSAGRRSAPVGEKTGSWPRRRELLLPAAVGVHEVEAVLAGSRRDLAEGEPQRSVSLSGEKLGDEACSATRPGARVRRRTSRAVEVGPVHLHELVATSSKRSAGCWARPPGRARRGPRS